MERLVVAGTINRNRPPAESIERAADRIISKFLRGDTAELTLADLMVLEFDLSRACRSAER